MVPLRIRNRQATSKQFASSFAFWILFCSSVFAESLPDPATKTFNPLYGVTSELLYQEPKNSTNQRFSNLQDTTFHAGTFRSQQVILRVSGHGGDRSGLDGRVVGEATFLRAE